MSAELSTPPVKEIRIWLLWLSICVQQLIFLLVYGLRIPLIAISTWVIFVPVVIIWVLYVVVPLLTSKTERKHTLLRTYALTGWVFVAAAVSWTVSYMVLSEKYGTPVSYEQMQEIQKKKTPNQTLQHNDPRCHAPCVRTCRASWGRG